MNASGPQPITYLNEDGDPFWPHRIRLPFRVKLEDKTWAEPGTLLLLDSGKAQRAAQWDTCGIQHYNTLNNNDLEQQK
jgi:hypothetical protein